MEEPEKSSVTERAGEMRLWCCPAMVAVCPPVLVCTWWWLWW